MKKLHDVADIEVKAHTDVTLGIEIIITILVLMLTNTHRGNNSCVYIL